MHPQTAKLIARISENLPEMADDLMQGWIDNPRGLKKTLQMALCPPAELSGLPDIDWVKTYQVLGLVPPAIRFPLDTAHWYIPVLETVTANHIIATLRRLGVTCDLYVEDLDTDLINDRDPKKGAYTIKVRRRVEADEENKNLSANQLKAQGHTGLTLIEYLLLFLGYYVTTGKYLDEENWTLPVGSRYSGGYVPDAHWRPGNRRLCVSLTLPDSRYGSLRSRSAEKL